MPYYADPDIPVYDHTVTQKLLHASTGEHDIAWIDNTTLLGYPPLSEDALTRCVTDEKIPRHITQAWGTFRVAEKPLWKRDCPGSVALALARNAVLVAGPREVVAWRLTDGGELWRAPLPAAPVPWGLAVDAEGRVVLTLVDGQVLALAGTN
jgi:hypothetical protein